MANADIVTFHMRDRENLTCGVKMYIETGHTAADVTAFAQAMTAYLDDITDAYIDSITWLSNIALPGAGEKVAATDTGNNRETGATFLWSMSGRDSESIYVPAILKAMVEGESISLTAAGGVGQDFVDQCELTVNTVDVTDGNEEALGTFRRVTKSIRG